MTINDFAFACSADNSPSYFTYEKETMMIIVSKENETANKNDFKKIEPFMESLISHESIHVVIKNLESGDISNSLDDIEVIVTIKDRKFQVTVNNMLFANDSSGLVIP
ncbi:MAG: hypothetical protein DA328_05310 [Nitrososphaeraceae archaeon]|nr:hypothetical protein [Nitrososphaeraceae archaeon]